jgi:transcriptional regulator with XRE-family HTH domain
MDSIKQKIKELMSKERYTIPTLAHDVGMTKANMYNILTKNQKVTIELLEELSKLFNVPMKYWFDDQGDPSMVREDGESYVKYMNDLVNALNKIIEMKDQELNRMREEINILKSNNK